MRVILNTQVEGEEFLAEVGSWGLNMQLQDIEFMTEQEGVQEEGYAENKKYLQ